MSFSLNEVEATAKRAARGAGYAWGIAEEAGKATRWLCAQGLDGPAELAKLLDMGFAGSLDQHMPQDLTADWVGEKDLCPLTCGAALSDYAKKWQADPLHLRRVAVPLLLLPFVAGAVRRQNAVATITLDGINAVTDGTRLSYPDANAHRADSVTVRTGGTLETTRPRRTRATPDPASWDVLTNFAFQTYAPATEQSRLLGAGAGLSDND